MEMSNLRQLHTSMSTIGAGMQQFAYRVNQAEFDCLFSTQERPYLLCLTSKGDSPHFFKFPVAPDTYEISNVMAPDQFAALAKLLRTDGSSWNRLIPKEFLKALDEHIPTLAKHRHVAPEEVIRLRSDITEQRDKPYFDTWMYWTETSERGPTPENQAKTLALMGAEALEHSTQFNGSTKWSAVPTGRTWQAERK